MLPAMSLSALSARARRVRKLYARLETKRGGRPWTRAELAQGFVGDVGDLMKLLMAKDGRRPAKNLDAALAHEFGDCLWCLLVLAEASGVDLEAAFLATMAELEQRLKPRRTTARRRTRTARTSRGRRG
jgi:NTP pyrophosphatase (non-canonical NTP hydrolase)